MARATVNNTERKRRTPAEIAQAELDKADARLAKAKEKHEAAQADVERYGKEVARAERFREFAATNPDLPQPEPTEAEDGVIDEPVGEDAPAE